MSPHLRPCCSPLLAVFLAVTACSDVPDAGSPSPTLPDGSVEVSLTAQVPEPGSDRSIRWSPYGKQLPLRVVDGGMEAQLHLGLEGTAPVKLRLTRSEGSPRFDQLLVDRGGNGEPVIRFSRRGYMQGTAVLNGVEAVVLVTESVMDGVYRPGDAWALASVDSAGNVLRAEHSRPVDEHAWLRERAYRVVDLHPSGRRVVLAPFDPGITREEEEELKDDLRVDREAPRSGGAVAFLKDFSEARQLAREEGKLLFIDFETTWCGPCKLMDQWVYTADAVVEAAAPLVAVKVDGDEHPDLKERFGVTGFPTMILLSPQGEELRRVSGYVNVAAMAKFLHGGG
jgi:thiol-disulfide isomerase/thioredoxin